MTNENIDIKGIDAQGTVADLYMAKPFMFVYNTILVGFEKNEVTSDICFELEQLKFIKYIDLKRLIRALFKFGHHAESMDKEHLAKKFIECYTDKQWI